MKQINIKSLLLLNLGALMDASGFYFFFAPNEIAAGGITGLSLVLSTFWPDIPIGIIVLIFSIILLLLGFLLVGPVFGFKTIYCSIIIPIFIYLMERLYPLSHPLTNDILVQLIFGVLISGIGLAVIFNQNSSSGGTDILARILNKFYGLDIGKGLLIIDFSITLLAGAAFGLNKGMYALLGVIMFSFTIDYVIEGINISKHVTVITDNSEEVRTYIINTLQRGATIYTAQGGYTSQPRDIIITIVNRREFIRLRNYIRDLDDQAFIFVQNTHEVLGEGFKPIE